jgi:hypothetical protein
MGEPQTETPDPLETTVDEAIAVCDGDIRAALKASIVANSFLAAENERLSHLVSRGYARGKTAARRASEKLDDWREISAGTDKG